MVDLSHQLHKCGCVFQLWETIGGKHLIWVCFFILLAKYETFPNTLFSLTFWSDVYGKNKNSQQKSTRWDTYTCSCIDSELTVSHSTFISNNSYHNAVHNTDSKNLDLFIWKKGKSNTLSLLCLSGLSAAVKKTHSCEFCFCITVYWLVKLFYLEVVLITWMLLVFRHTGECWRIGETNQ